MTRRALLTLLIVAAVPALARAELVSETWAGPKAKATHPGTMTSAKVGGAWQLSFDLSAIPNGANVRHASLYCFTGRGAQPNQDPRLIPAGGNEPLKLEGPWYRSFDATSAVAKAVAADARTLTVTAERFEDFNAPASYLRVVYEGSAKELGEQVAGLRTVHHDGQTFVIFREHPEYRPKPEEIIWIKRFAERGDTRADGPGRGDFNRPNHPGITLRALRRMQGLALRDQPSGFHGIKGSKRAREVLPVAYRVYRHSRRITADNIGAAELLAEVGPLSGLDQETYTIHFKGEYIDQREEPESTIPAYCVAKGSPVTPGEGLYVHTVHGAGKGYYAVTMVVAGTENLSAIGEGNSLAQPVDEQVGTPQPILQWVQEDNYHKEPPEYWYRYWCAPPYCNLPAKSLRVAVAVADDFAGPGPLLIGTISGTFNVRGSIRLPRTNRVEIQIERQLAWLPALFYNEGMGTLRGLTDCKVDYYSERTMQFMINWIMGKYKIDRSKIEGGMLHFGLRHPEIFTKMQMGSYTAGYDLRFAPGGPSMPRVLGPQGIRTVRGEDAWKMYSVAEYVNAHPDRDIPFLVCISGTGKDGGHTSEFGWQDDPRGWRGLLSARQTFVAAFSSGLSGEMGQAFARMRWDGSIPAFSNCSLDDNPGNGDPAEGDYYGQINGSPVWGDTDQADEAARWEMSVWLLASCPAEACTVDVTPRHCEKFRPKAGQSFSWSNRIGGRVVQKGRVTADKWGLVTLGGVKVTRAKHRLTITRD